MTLAKVIRWNTDVTGLQGNVFFDKSVMLFEAPEAGANVTLTAANGSLTLTDTRTGQVLDRESLSSISASDPGRLGGGPRRLQPVVAAGGPAGGVEVYGGRSGGDVNERATAVRSQTSSPSGPARST